MPSRLCKVSFSLTSLAIVGLVTCGSASAASLSYTIKDLGTLGGSKSTGFSMNRLGQVVGTSDIPGNTGFHAFRTAPNQAINPATDDLGTLFGAPISGANGINDLGQVVGYSRQASGGELAFRTG
ncbi:MAG TPA: hypothetical protein V6D12_22910, partial [Candidatus Obscuribacterales bacterium]